MDSALGDYRNSFINLALPYVVFAEPGAVKHNTIKYVYYDFPLDVRSLLLIQKKKLIKIEYNTLCSAVGCKQCFDLSHFCSDQLWLLNTTKLVFQSKMLKGNLFMFYCTCRFLCLSCKLKPQVIPCLLSLYFLQASKSEQSVNTVVMCFVVIHREGLSYSIWDHWTVHGRKDFTLQDFINWFKVSNIGWNWMFEIEPFLLKQRISK